MSNIPLHSTDQVPSRKFPLHGQVTFAAVGRVLETNACGPFNRELMDALAVMAFRSFPTMAAWGRWAQLVVFRESALASMDILNELTRALKDLKSAGLAPPITAYCLPHPVEGAMLMAPLYHGCFQEAGLPLAVFHELDLAKDWVAVQLAAP